MLDIQYFCYICNKEIFVEENECAPGYCSEECFKLHIKQHFDQKKDILFQPYVPLQITKIKNDK